MARGQQKIQSQQKNAERQAKMKKGGTDQKKAAMAALKIICPVCIFYCLQNYLHIYLGV